MTVSRRDLIKKGAVAGAVFWSVPIIESVTARAAAQSNCINGSTFTASYVWVIFNINGGSTYYFTGVKNSGTFDQGSSPGGSVSCPANNPTNTFVLPAFNGASHMTAATVNGTAASYFEASGTCPGAGNITNPGSSNSPNNLVVVTSVGGKHVCDYVNFQSTGSNTFTVSSANGATIQAYFVFQGSNLTALCGPGTLCATA